MRRSVVDRRLRDGTTFGRYDTVSPREAAEFLRSNPLAVPAPIGADFPHRPGSSPCDLEHPIWSEWQDAYEAAKERAAIETEGQDDEAYQRAVLAALREHPQFDVWERTTRACVDGIERRKRQRTPKAAMSTHRERALERIAFIRAGGDPTSSEWTDRLASTKGRKRALKYHRAA